jgi:hypothetical protein
MTFKGSNGIHVKAGSDAAGNPQIEFEGDTYEIHSGETDGKVAVKLTSDKTGNDTEVAFVGGKRTDEEKVNVEISQKDDVVTITARDTVNKTFEITTEDKQEGFKFAVYDNHNGDVTASVNPVIKYGKNGSKTAKFIGDDQNNGTATLNVYSIDEIN